MQLKSKSALFVAGAIVLMLTASGFTVVGMMIGMKWNASSTQIMPIELHADSAARGKALSFATGMVDDGVEGLFVLDHLTGNLQCWILNKISGDIGGIYATNIGKDMQIEKVADGDFVMTTGRVKFNPMNRRGNVRPGQCICYVGDGNTGKVIGYGLEFNPQAIAQGAAQQDELLVICKGMMREAMELRDQ